MTTAFQSDAFQNDAFQIDGLTPVVVATPITGGGAYKRQIPKRKHWLEEHREREEARKSIFRASKPVDAEARRTFKVRLPEFQLPDVDIFIDEQESITKKRLRQEEEELMELLQIL